MRHMCNLNFYAGTNPSVYAKNNRIINVKKKIKKVLTGESKVTIIAFVSTARWRQTNGKKPRNNQC